MSKPRRKSKPVMPTPVVERPVVPPPDWFAESVGLPLVRAKRSFWSNTTTATVRQIIEGFGAGQFAMPPWQRAAVWTRDQRIKLLDSIIRGASIGPITLWKPRSDVEISERLFDDCTYQRPGPGSYGGAMVIDGQQRLTTLLLASRGEIGVRWNGVEWTDGKGFIDDRLATAESTSDLRGWYEYAHTSPNVDQFFRDMDAVRNYQVTFMTIEGSAADMVETYRRLATCGTPHSVEDLSVMERWMSERGES